MKITAVYTDNYRGFIDTVIPLAKVNFLVGENSTGKSSFLKLIELITSTDFWYNGEFRTQDVDLSYFGDVTAGSSSKVSRVGLLYQMGTAEENSGSYYALSLTLTKGPDGKTTSKNLKCVLPNGTEVIIVRSLTHKGMKYIYRSNRIKVDGLNFASWVNEEVPTKGYTKIELETISFEQSPYFSLSYAIHFGSKRQDGEVKGIEGISSLPVITNSYIWMAPIRIKPKRTYDGNIYDYSADGAHAPYLLKNIFSRRNSKSSAKLVSALNKFGKSSGLFDEIKIKNFTKQANAPFSIEVIIGGESRNIENVGYGVSQVVPIITEILSHSHARFAIQQPEIHLHPKAQASLGELFYSIAEEADSSFIVETHSDFIIDRYRQKMSKGRQNSEAKDAQVVFFEASNATNKATRIEILPDGSYSKEQPVGFKKFFFDEELRNLSI